MYLKTLLISGLMILAAFAVADAPTIYAMAFTRLWPFIHDSMLAWDGPSETVATSNGTTVILQYEEGDSGVDQVSAAIEGAVTTASFWETIPFPVTVRIVRDSMALKIIPSEFVMQPVGRTFGDFVVVLSPGSDVTVHGKRHKVQNQIEGILAHEFTHVVMQDVTGNYGGGFQSAPTWFVEGAARYTAGEASDFDDEVIGRHSERDMSRLVNNWYSFYTIDPSGAYEASGTLFAHLYEDEGQATMRLLMADLKAGAAFDDAFERRYGMSVQTFVDRWWDGVRKLEYADHLGYYSMYATREHVEDVCAKPARNPLRGFDPCVSAFEDLYRCPRDLPGVCLTDYEMRMFSMVTIVGEIDPADRISHAPWAIDCHCMDDGPWPTDFADTDDASSD